MCKRRGYSYELKEVIELLFHKMTDDPMNNKDIKKVGEGGRALSLPHVGQGEGWPGRLGPHPCPAWARMAGLAGPSSLPRVLDAADRRTFCRPRAPQGVRAQLPAPARSPCPILPLLFGVKWVGDWLRLRRASRVP